MPSGSQLTRNSTCVPCPDPRALRRAAFACGFRIGLGIGFFLASEAATGAGRRVRCRAFSRASTYHRLYRSDRDPDPWSIPSRQRQRQRAYRHRPPRYNYILITRHLRFPSKYSSTARISSPRPPLGSHNHINFQRTLARLSQGQMPPYAISASTLDDSHTACSRFATEKLSLTRSNVARVTAV